MRAWQLDERAHAGPEHLDRAYVAGYDAKSGGDTDAELAVLFAHGLDSETTFVDLGAGTGRLAVAAAPHCRRVVAVDVSPAMLAVASERAAASGAANVELVEAGFLTYEHRGARPQLVYSRNALHHLPDFWKAIALTRVRDLLPQGGLFVLRDLVFSFEPAEAGERLDEWFAGAAASAEAGWTRAELEEHVREEHSTFSWLLAPLLEHAGFEIVHVDHRRSAYSTYACRAR